MNICHINLARGFSGGENQTLTLIKEHVKRGYSITVVAKKSSPFAQACKALDCTLVEVKSFLTGHSRRVTNTCNCMHVHEGQAVYWALIQHLLHGPQYIITRRIDNPLKNKWLSRLAYRKASTLVGVSRAIEKILRTGFPNSNTSVVHDSPVAYDVNESVLSELKSRYANKFVIVQAAKMYKHKGFDVSIAAAKILSKEPDIQFCLLGDGPESNNLRNSSKGCKNIEFLGLQKDMGAWFSRADIVVLPSYTEGMGSVLLEASLAGVPVIGTRTGGIPDAINPGVSGLLIDTGNPQQLADAILELKNNVDLQTRIRQRTPAFIARFDIKHAADLYDRLYRA